MSGMVFDRTNQDILAALAIRKKMQEGETLSENEVYQMERGFLSTSTLNRVEEKIAEIYERLATMGYHIEEIETKEWTAADFFKRADLLRFAAVCNDLYEKYPYFRKNDTQNVTDNQITIGYINSVEHLLSDIDDMTQNAQSAYVYSAEGYSGSEVFITEVTR